jgi:hypothetical protein
MDNRSRTHIIVKRYLGMLPGTYGGLSTDTAGIGHNKFGIDLRFLIEPIGFGVRFGARFISGQNSHK